MQTKVTPPFHDANKLQLLPVCSICFQVKSHQATVDVLEGGAGLATPHHGELMSFLPANLVSILPVCSHFSR